jgi:membrane glycosyltransferase
MALLLFPKFVGLARALVRAPTRRRFGGAGRLIPGALTEIVLSALYAPIMMLMQTRQLIEILAGGDSGWTAQARSGSHLPWSAALARHWRHLVTGLVVGGGLLYAAPQLLPWLAPILAGLILAPWLSRVSGDPAFGRLLAAWGLLRIPEEVAPNPILVEASAQARHLAPRCDVSFHDLCALDHARKDHAASLTATDRQGADPLDIITARAKLAAAPSVEDGVDWLTEPERRAVVAHPEMLETLSLPRRVAS